MARRRSILLVAAALALGAVRPGVSRHPPDIANAMSGNIDAFPTVPSPSAWPAETVIPQALPLRFPDGFGTARVFIDPGHGAAGNTGNRSAWCEDEQDFTLAAALHLADTLTATGHFEARLGRRDSPVPYPDRVRAAEQWGAQAFISLHSDVRGTAEPWSPRDGTSCPRADQAPGFSVLLSDDAPDDLALQRSTLARLVADRLATAGFVPYDGFEYTQSYDVVPGAPGVFLDRHALDKRIYVLRQPSMPSIIIETHNALHALEASRFRDPRTLEAMDAAVADALIALLSPPSRLACGI